MRQVDYDAFGRIFELELLIRRALRWELRGRFGRRWLVQVPEIGDAIEDRRGRERQHGLHDPRSSDLSYLGLGEAAHLIFRPLWEGIFKTVLSNRRSLGNNPMKGLLVVRNKVAHFRAIAEGDLNILASASDLEKALASYYVMILRATANVSGDPDLAGDVGILGQEAELRAALSGRGLDRLWEAFGFLEAIRASGISPGLGLVDHHLYFELYTRGSFAARPLINWARTKDAEVTYLMVGRRAQYVRLLMPTAIGEAEIIKAMRALCNVAREGQGQEVRSDDQVSYDFDFGSLDCVVGEGHNSIYGLAF